MLTIFTIVNWCYFITEWFQFGGYAFAIDVKYAHRSVWIANDDDPVLLPIKSSDESSDESDVIESDDLLLLDDN